MFTSHHLTAFWLFYSSHAGPQNSLISLQKQNTQSKKNEPILSSAIKLAPCHPKITLLGRSPGVPARNKILLSSLLQRRLRNWKTILQKIHMDNEANVTHTKKGKARGVLKVSNLFFSLKQMPLHFSAILVGKIFCLSWI